MPLGRPLTRSFFGMDFQRRLWGHIDCPSIEDCWEWQGYKQDGYGIIGHQHSLFRVHRVVFLLLKDELASDLVIDHLCRNRACCNPAHLEQVPNNVNTRRGQAPAVARAREGLCKHGHEMTPDNIYKYPNGRRECITCRKARHSSLKT